MENPSDSVVSDIMERAVTAAAVFSQLDQAQTDRVVRAAYEAGFNARVKLAKMAHEETGIGKWEDKVLKNVIATLLVHEDIKHEKTVGIVSEDRERGITEFATPLGPICAVIPMTNPTSTVLFKILIALKTRNPIIIRPHRSAARSSIEAARICYEAALKEDAPEDCIQWVQSLTREQTHELMGHPKLALVLATGGESLVRAAYSSGTPAFGVGAGNVPVFIEKSADPAFAVDQILLSKTFDNGTVCASEQAIVVEDALAEAVARELSARQAHFLTPEECRQVEQAAFDREKGIMNANIVGNSALQIAEKAGISVPEGTRLLVARLEDVGEKYPLSSEILAPILAFYVARSFEQALNLCIDLNFHGGMGHTASIFSNDEDKILKFSSFMKAGRIVVNMPSSQGGVGGVFNKLHPSFTLGCGTSGKNITTDNITARNLLNIQRITRRRTNERFCRFDPKMLLDDAWDATSVEAMYNRNY
ncbi:MAG: aldehyde dehydrogenase family protein [Deltaproteobacteria bacterium]|nr:aldehyde dehydrogenase family protein [Deltaproteobacteria bacterium]